MDQPVVSLTAVFLKGKHGYTAFVEELPGVNSQGHTLQEAIDSPGFPIMMRQRLRVVQRELFDQLDGLAFG